MNLIIDHIPQDELYHDIVSVMSVLPEVLGVIQRGSYANDSVDRASDLDVLVIVEDTALRGFIAELVPRLKKLCDFLTEEGWVDTIVPDFGGIGLVYLVEKKGKLVQLDIYITAASAATRILKFPAKKILFQRSKLAELQATNTALSDEAHEVFTQHAASVRAGSQHLLEVAIMYEIYAKHLYRRNSTLALKYRYELIEAIAKLIRYVFTPGKVDYKMYDWTGDFARTNSPIIRMFERNIELIDIYSEQQLKDLVRVVYTLYFESALSTQHPEFLHIMQSVDRYARGLLNPDYTHELEEMELTSDDGLLAA